MTIKATNDCVWVIRDSQISEQGGVLIPDAAKKIAHKGKVITTGKLVSDSNIKDGKTVIFNKSSGFELEENGETYTILRQGDIIGII